MLSKILGGALLVTGTCIGAGMLGLPVVTAAGGFYDSAWVYLVVWAIMTLTAFLMLEVSLWFEGDINLITMAKGTLGKHGANIAWIIYLLFLYSLMAAYISGGSSIFVRLLEYFNFSCALCLPITVLIFASIVFFGAHLVDVFNRWLMLCLVIAFVSLVYLVFDKVEPELLYDGQSKYLLAALPIIVTSFGFHLLIPTLKVYFKENVNQLRIAIFLGGLLPFLVYLLWNFIIMGVIPAQGEEGLIALMGHKDPIVGLTNDLNQILHSSKVTGFANAFAAFALFTSLVAVALGLFDFLADGFKIKKTFKGKSVLIFLTFLPPALFAQLSPKGFLLALKYAGVFASILLIIYPALMAISGRYFKNFSLNHYQVSGRIYVPVIALLFGVVVIFTEIGGDFNLLPMP